MTQRTDAHSPTNMDPTAYTYLYAYDREALGPSDRSDWATELRGKAVFHANGGCARCGAHIRYVALIEHTSGDIIGVGETCLDNRFSLQSKAQFDALRKAAQLDREAQRIKSAWLAQLDVIGAENVIAYMMLCGDEAYASFVDGIEQVSILTEARAHHIVSDIRRRFRQYGSVSVSQVALVAKIHIQVHEQAMRKAAPEVAKVAGPEGRLVIEGKVVSLKWVESDYGSTQKMLVVVTTAAGEYKVYCSVPSSIDPVRGDVVRFTATCARSHDDESFVIGKRPSKAVIL